MEHVYEDRPGELARLANAGRYKIARIEEASCECEVRDAVAAGKRVLWVVNQVSRAQLIASRLSDLDVLLICYHRNKPPLLLPGARTVTPKPGKYSGAMSHSREQQQKYGSWFRHVTIRNDACFATCVFTEMGGLYVEKPCSHNIREGQLLVKATKRHGKVLAQGTQSRSSPSIQQAMKLLRDGVIGDVLIAKCWNWHLP
jgi:hypothetical protein